MLPLADRVRLVDELIKQDPSTTIKEFVNEVREIESEIQAIQQNDYEKSNSDTQVQSAKQIQFAAGRSSRRGGRSANVEPGLLPS